MVKITREKHIFPKFPRFVFVQNDRKFAPKQNTATCSSGCNRAQDGRGSCECWNWELSSRGSLLQLQASFFPCLPFGLNRETDHAWTPFAPAHYRLGVLLCTHFGPVLARHHFKQGVCHIVALSLTLKSSLRQKKKNYENSNISRCKSLIFKRIL